MKTLRPRVAWTVLLLLAGVGLAKEALAPAVPLAAQERLQLPADAGTHGVGDLFIQELDAVWTAAGEVLEGASILIRDGVIRELGADLEAPEGVRVLEGSGRTAIPGIVDEHTHAAQIGTNEGTAPIVPEVRVIDALDPTSFSIFRALQGGVTTARVMHGSSNPIGGQSAVVKMRWGAETPEELLVPGAPRAVKFALGENVTRKPAQNRGPANRFPASRAGVESLYDQAFTAAAEYRELWERYGESPDEFRVPPRRDLRLEALVDIMEDRIRVHAHSYRSDEILMLMRMAERHGFRIDNFTHVLEGYRVADELREHGAGASTFSDWWQFKLESYDAIPYNAALMAERGVLTALNSDLTWLQPFMKWEIAKPVQYGGASREEALRMLTLNPAIMIGVDDRVGSLEVGKEGDVVLLTGDPFDAYSRVEYTIIDGLVYFDSKREEELRGEAILPVPELPTDRYRAGSRDRMGPEAPAAESSPSSRNLGSGEAPSPGNGVPGDPEVRGIAADSMDSLNPDVGLVALVGATIHPVSRPPIADGVLVIHDGRIQAVGPRGQVEIPADAREIDLAGRHLYPGMMDPVTHLGLFEIGAIAQATDRNEIGGYNPHIPALPAYQPHGRAPAVARARGITSVLTAQSGGVIQGMGSVVHLEGDTFERSEIRRAGAVMVDLPVPPTGPMSGSMEPSRDSGDLAALLEFLQRSREYAEAEATDRAADAPFEANLRGIDAVALGAMVPVMAGEVPVLIRADSEWQIHHALLLLEEFPELDGVLVGGAEASRVVGELAEADLPVILTRTRRPTPDRDDSVGASMWAAAALHAAGVRVAFGTDDSADVRTLPEHAAVAVSHGLPMEVGLEAVTRRPAEFLGLDQELGSLDPGLRADLVVTDGDLLQPLTRIESLFIGGRELDPRDNDHQRMYDQFRGRR